MKRKNQALTLGEILLALALMSIVLVSATLTLQWALRGNIEQRNQTEAAFIAQKVTEELWSRPALPETSQGNEQNKTWESIAKPVDSQMTDLTVAVYGSDRNQKLYQLSSQRRSFKRIVLIQNKDGIWQKHEDLAKLRLIAPGITSEFSISPDCKNIAYTTLLSGARQIVWAPLENLQKKQSLLAPPPQCLEPCFSPDGKQLSFTAYINNRAQVCVADTQTGKWFNRSSSGNEEGSASWNPDGKNLVWCRDGNQIVLTKGNDTTVLFQDSQWKYKPRISSNGKMLTFAGGGDGGPHIYTYEFSTQKTTRRTQQGFHKKPVFSVDGGRILYLKDAQVESINLDGTATEALTNPDDGQITDHTWLGTP